MSAKIRILFVDDDPCVLQGLQRSLRSMRQDWEMSFVGGGEAAVKELEQNPFDVVVSDLRMPGMDGVQLLTLIKQRYPEITRIALSGHSSKEAMLRTTGPIHQFLPKPCNVARLKATIRRAITLQGMLQHDHLRRLTAQLETLPCLRANYARLIEELDYPETTVHAIGRIISKDVALYTRILQTVNSAYFGLRRRITSIDDAISLVGLNMIRVLVLGSHVFNRFIGEKVLCINAEQLHNHSLQVGLTAKKIAANLGALRDVSDRAMLAGMMHDIGKLVFAGCMADEYRSIFSSSTLQGPNLCRQEQAALGADHSRIGGYLLGLWGFADDIIEAVAFHHDPSNSLSEEVNPFGAMEEQSAIQILTAVHAADALSLEQIGISDALDSAYLEKLNVMDRMEKWRESQCVAGAAS
ncbi:MAG: HDOD domain-containing protein [Sedimentisphaerales bacterium]|nr:HDOD domain-containing protein [Sedimentisphaerales bacterium]